MRSGPGDAERAVAAVGAQLKGEPGIGAADCGVEKFAFLVADVDQERLLVGERVDGGKDVVEVAATRIGLDICRAVRLPAVTDLAGLHEVGHCHTQPPHRGAQEGHSLLQAHGRQPRSAAIRIGAYVAAGLPVGARSPR
jgi:hypothetical protein